MMKSWADHCSSDEDTDDNHSVESEQSLGEAFTEKVQVEEELPTEVGEPEQQNVRTYDFPDRPPFTAFVGNLSYDIQESSQLQQALADVVFDRLGQRVNVLGGRISYERNSKDSKQHRGFGYVELETLEELKIVMKLNDDGQAMLAGRKIQVDTANHHNRPNKNFNRRGGHNQNDHRESFNRPQNNEPFEKVDGTKFRGGKYNNKNNNSFRNSNHNNNNSFRNSNHNNNNSFNNSSFSNGGDAPRQRPSLKLAPRSKPVDGGGKSLSSDIFGGAKARDEQAWEKSRQRQEKQADEKKSAAPSKKGGDDGSINKKEQQDRRQSGRGGGRGAKGRGNRGGRGDQNPRRGSARRQSHQQSDKKQDKRQSQTSPEEKATAAAKTNSKAADTTPSNPEPKAPKNKFLLLMDDSDSD